MPSITGFFPNIGRRQVVLGAGAALAAPSIARAQSSEPIRVGFLTVKTGPLAAGGIQMEQGLNLFFKQHNNMLAGRAIQLFTADTGGIPANARTKTQELVEQNKVAVIIGPLAAFELLAFDDYTRAHKVPIIACAAAEDITQRTPDPHFVRTTSSSAQCCQPLADYAAKDLKYKRMATIGDDIAYGQEQNAGFQRVFEDAGGKIVQKLWPALNAPDYGTFIAQLKPDLDGVFMSFAGSNGFRFFKQYKEYGNTAPLLGGMTAVDEAVLPQMGDEAIGMISANWYSAELDNQANVAFVDAMRKEYKVDPGYYAAGTYVAGEVLDAALQKVKGQIEDKDAFIHALRTDKVENTIRGPVSFDEFGNVVGNVYIRKVANLTATLILDEDGIYDPAGFNDRLLLGLKGTMSEA